MTYNTSPTPAILYSIISASMWLMTICLLGCQTPRDTQDFFVRSTHTDPMLEPVHKTELYTVYYDHGLKRCVLHSAYSWGESGGGTGGTGLGIHLFNCDPDGLKRHSERLQQRIREGQQSFDFPVRTPKTAPASQATVESPATAPTKTDSPPNASALEDAPSPLTAPSSSTDRHLTPRDESSLRRPIPKQP